MSQSLKDFRQRFFLNNVEKTAEEDVYAKNENATITPEDIFSDSSLRNVLLQDSVPIIFNRNNLTQMAANDQAVSESKVSNICTKNVFFY